MKQRIKNWCLKHLFSAIVEKDLVNFRRGETYIGTRKLTQAQAQVLYAKAGQIIRNDAYSLIIQELNYLAKEKIFYKEDNEFGKAMLYSISLLENKLKSLSSMQK